MTYFVGQGKVFAALRDGTVNPTGGFLYLGNCPDLRLRLGASALVTATGGAQTAAPGLPNGEPPSFQMTLEELNNDNLTNFLYGTRTTVAAGSVSNESVTLYKGRATKLARMGLSSFTSLSGGYTLGTHYTVNLDAGSIDVPLTSTIPDGTTLLASYVAKDQDQIEPYTTAPPLWWLRFEGMNSANSNTPVVIDLYRTRIRPPEELQIIGDDLTALSLTGRILYDTNRWFRITKL